jgi:long-subunit fatty acid transport protein
LVVEKVKTRGNTMLVPTPYFQLFHQKNFKIGLATSSPQALIDIVVEKQVLPIY